MSKSLHGQFCIGPVFYNVTSVSVAFPLFLKSFLPFIFEPAPPTRETQTRLLPLWIHSSFN